MKTVDEIISSLKEEGFSHEFFIQDGALICNSNGQNYDMDDLLIEKTEIYRSIDSGNTMLYAISAKDGIKGILIHTSMGHHDQNFGILIEDIPLKNIRSSRNEL